MEILFDVMCKHHGWNNVNMHIHDISNVESKEKRKYFRFIVNSSTVYIERVNKMTDGKIIERSRFHMSLIVVDDSWWFVFFFNSLYCSLYYMHVHLITAFPLKKKLSVIRLFDFKFILSYNCKNFKQNFS